MLANTNKVRREAARLKNLFQLNTGRKIFFISFVTGCGFTIGGYFFPPLLIGSGISFISMITSQRYIERSLGNIISEMKPNITLEELIQDAIPDHEYAPSTELVSSHRPASQVKKVEAVSSDVWAQQIFFSDAHKASTLAPAPTAGDVKDVKDDDTVSSDKTSPYNNRPIQ